MLAGTIRIFCVYQALYRIHYISLLTCSVPTSLLGNNVVSYLYQSKTFMKYNVTLRIGELKIIKTIRVQRDRMRNHTYLTDFLFGEDQRRKDR